MPCCQMTRDGFVFLVMGYTGKKAAQFKEFYIKRFNEMEAQIKALVNARQQFPKLTRMVKAIHENPRPYHYSNECDLLNRIVLGMSAKQFCNIVKFQLVLNEISSGNIDSFSKIAADYRFYDQSHFIHEFKSYTGMTPSDYSTALKIAG